MCAFQSLQNISYTTHTCVFGSLQGQLCVVFILYLTRSGSVTVKLSRAEQAVSILGSRANAAPPFPRMSPHPWVRKATRRPGVARVSNTFLGASSAERWHRAGRRYLERGGGAGERLWLKILFLKCGQLLINAHSLGLSTQAALNPVCSYQEQFFKELHWDWNQSQPTLQHLCLSKPLPVSSRLQTSPTSNWKDPGPDSLPADGFWRSPSERARGQSLPP